MVGSGTQTLTSNGDTSSANYTMNGLGVKIGFITQSQNRLEISINQLKGHNDNGNDTYTGFETNYLFVFMNQKKFHPYIGLGIGYYESKNMTGENEDTGETEHAKAISLGGSVGLLYSLTEKIELETAIQYRYLEWNYSDVDLTDSITNAYLGANYKF